MRHNTGLGIRPTRAASLGKSPREINNAATTYPTRRAATPVRLTTPLFCEKVVLGMVTTFDLIPWRLSA